MPHGQTTGEGATRFGASLRRKAVQRLQHQWRKTIGEARRRMHPFTLTFVRVLLNTGSQ
jgi:hypothetical protein